VSLNGTWGQVIDRVIRHVIWLWLRTQRHFFSTLSHVLFCWFSFFFILVCWWMHFVPPFIICVLMVYNHLTLDSPNKQTTTTTNIHNKIIILQNVTFSERWPVFFIFKNPQIFSGYKIWKRRGYPELFHPVQKHCQIPSVE
jgi:hypothetical protein